LAFKDAVKKLLPGGGKKQDEDWMFLQDQRTIGFDLRRPFERQWAVNLAFLANRQYSFYNNSTEMIQQLTAQKGRVRIVDNQILPHFQKQVSRMIRNMPRMSVVPASSDNEDLKAAKKGDKVLKWYWREYEMRKKIRQLSGWIYSCGNGFMADYWNPRLGPMSLGPDGKMSYLGDAEVVPLSPFEVLAPDTGSGTVDVEQLEWIIVVRWHPLSWFANNFSKGKEVTEESRTIQNVDTNALFGMGNKVSAQSKLPGALYTEMRMKPCTLYPKGLFLGGANGIILQKEDYPYESYHIQQFKDVEVPGCFWGLATLESGVWLQKLHNRTLSDLAEFNRTSARGKFLVPRNSKLETAIDDTHGQVLLYTPVMGHKPEMMILRALPTSYVTILQAVAQSFMNLYHQHEVTQGTNKSDIRSGEMVSLLLEQDDFGNVPTHAIFEESLEALFSRVLRRIQKGYTSDRVISITGKDGAYEVINFTGADLKNNTDVIVTKESSIPDSKVARQARVKENYKDGLYGNPNDSNTRERVLKMLDEVPDEFKDIFEEDNMDRQVAQIENASFLINPQVKYLVNVYDNHKIHGEEHTMARKQPEYQKLKYEKPQLFMAYETCFNIHQQQHDQLLAEQMKQQEAQMARIQALQKGVQQGA
jgi:hypothetical protein